jgi:hypothetical protein
MNTILASFRHANSSFCVLGGIPALVKANLKSASGTTPRSSYVFMSINLAEINYPTQYRRILL